MNSKILRELCELAYQSCKIELDGARAVNTDKLPGVLLALIDAYMMGTSYASHQARHGVNAKPQQETGKAAE